MLLVNKVVLKLISSTININFLKLKKVIFLLYFTLVSITLLAQIGESTLNDWAWNQVGINSDFKKLRGKKKITIAIIDDAFIVDNQIIKEYLKTNSVEIADNNLDDDNNGKTDDYLGWDISDNDSNVNPPKGGIAKFSHGTKVAGIVIEGLNKMLLNAKEVVKILPIKSSSDTRNNNYITDGYEAIKYAIEQKADIIVCCWSGGVFDKEKEEILKQAQAAGIIIVASSGNFVTEKEQFPSAFPWVINTAAIEKSFKKQKVSNYGKFVDLSVPGDSILTISLAPNLVNNFLSGTSASAAFLGGIVAAVKTANPNIKSQDFDRILKNACDPLEKFNPLYKGKLGAGVLNLNKLIENLQIVALNTNFYTPKGYIEISKTKKKVFSNAKYPSFKISNTSIQTPKNLNFILEIWKNNKRNDTTLNLNTPFFFQADSFEIYSIKNLKSKIKSFLYFEAQVIDSSTVYCSETIHLNAPSGMITDGSGEENYANNSNCKWEREVAPNKRIKINFEEMDLEAKIDQIYIFSDFGTESPILAIFSGQNLPPQITSWSNKVLIWFVSNNMSNQKGWTLKYEEVD
jgi:serine protease